MPLKIALSSRRNPCSLSHRSGLCIAVQSQAYYCRNNIISCCNNAVFPFQNLVVFSRGHCNIVVLKKELAVAKKKIAERLTQEKKAYTKMFSS
ncbi:hypothetical protein V2J09_004410 [Rumex salicifolius]